MKSERIPITKKSLKEIKDFILEHVMKISVNESNMTIKITVDSKKSLNELSPELLRDFNILIRKTYWENFNFSFVVSKNKASMAWKF
ncbi:MAG: hypothetical protein ACD_4C00200G0005 [uncultured bacterium (gcode 4)]|uniref:Uncharacterized protein n=1 Tax=uncultured bacterium (gcode 4) TaxID=1234023 RepID=K2FXR4_9BACT|nr:MAG: hypothetical protein ACD_4C00200G0005 [uncultured bacterium (gcode 4)]